MATTTSPRSVARLEPFTLPHFELYARRLILDSGDPWPIEDWQLDIVGDILSGFREVWVLIPEGNGKTTLMAGFALYHLDFTPSPWVPIGAASRDQAEILFGQAAGFVERTPGLDARQSANGRFKVFEGYRKIMSTVNGGRGLKVYAADKATGDGVIPTLCLVDEPHRHKDLGLYRTWKGKLKKRNAQIVAISTAGEPGTDFEKTRDKIRDQAKERTYLNKCHLRAVGNGIVMHEFKVPKPDQVRDLDLVALANPLWTEAELRDKLESPTLDFGEDWLRLTCNIPARSSKAAVSEQDWDRAETREEIPEGAPVWVGADFAWLLDTTAVIPLWMKSPEERLFGDPIILEPPRDGTMLDPQEVKNAFEQIHERNPIEVVVMDRSKAEDTALWLENELGVQVVIATQAPSEAAVQYERFMEALRGGAAGREQSRAPWIRHTGHPGFREHVMNAIARKLPGDKYRFDRPSPSRNAAKQDQRVIDALTAASMVHATAAASPQKPEASRVPVFH